MLETYKKSRCNKVTGTDFTVLHPGYHTQLGTGLMNKR
jgi:hypothetical protein